MNADTFASRLRKEREAKKFTQQKMAEKLHLTAVAYGAWERGENEPSIRNLVNICNILGVTSDWLIGLDDSTRRTDTTRRVSRLGGGADVMQSVLDRMKVDIAELEKMV